VRSGGASWLQGRLQGYAVAMRELLRRACGTGVVLSLLAVSALGCGGDDDGSEPPIAVLSAFPAELAAVVARAEIATTMPLVGVADRRIRVGTLDGVPVVVAMTGIGIANADNTARAVLDNFDVAGVVFSGVAGASERIADVVVAESWVLDDGMSYAADAAWLEVARAVASRGIDDLATCVDVNPDLAPSPLCLTHEPRLVVGGVGHSSGFAVDPVPCRAGDPVFGCDSDAVATSAPAALVENAAAVSATAAFAVEDMESAAVARVAAARGVPFVAFRGVSDGAGDPLDLPGFPSQFFTYYPLAAENAARAVEAFLGALR